MGYNGAATARWAAQNARVRQPFAHSCALFVSRGLWIGSLPQTQTWNESSETVFRGVRGTSAALRANELVCHLTRDGIASLNVVYEEPRLETATIPDARRGDVLAFDWYGEYGDGRWSHVAIVTDVRRGVPYVSEWGTAGQFNLVCFYTMRRWNWSENAQMHLGEHYPDMVVTLLRVV